MRPLPTAAFAATLLVISGCTLRDVPGAGVPDPDYPPAPRSEQVDMYFGVEVADPYRWMEDLGAPEVTAWVDAQNAVSVPWLHGLPGYGRFHRRITALWDYERYTPPRVHGGRYFFEYNDGRSDLSTLMVQQGWEGDRRVLIDPATLSEDRTVLLARWNASPDGKFVAWAASDGGTDWTQWRIRSVDTGQDLPEVLRGTKFTEARWLPDSSGFFYSRYPRSGGGWDDQQPVGIWFHAKGTPQSEDRKVFAVTDHPTRNPYGRVSSDGQHLVIEVHQDSRTSGLFYLPMNAPQADAVRLVDSWNGTVSYLGSIDGRFVLKTDIGAPLGRIVAVDPDRPGEGGWVDLVAEARFAIEDAVIAGDQLIVHYLQDAHSRIDVFALDGSAAGGIALPGIGKVAALSGTPGDPEIFVRYESFTNPGAILRYRPADGETDLFHQARTTLDTGSLVTEQVFYESADGTRVPMFLVHRAGLVRDATQPTLLYGYGGFNLPQLPSFDIRWAAWLDAGGVLALANIRGGGEYGAAWHAAGTRERKQNVFDDFIAAAVWLIESGVTGHAALSHHQRQRPGLVRRLRPVRDRIRLPGPVRLLSRAQPRPRHLLSADADPDRRRRRPGPSLAQLQVRGRPAACPGLRGARSAEGGDTGGARVVRRQAPMDAYRGAGRALRLHCLGAGGGASRGGLSPSSSRKAASPPRYTSRLRRKPSLCPPERVTSPRAFLAAAWSARA
jgi:prolyl oligopeptidase